MVYQLLRSVDIGGVVSGTLSILTTVYYNVQRRSLPNIHRYTGTQIYKGDSKG